MKKAYEGLRMNGDASPGALTYACGAVGSYVPTEDGGGSNTVVYNKSGGN